jgi:hypothetical protein
MAIKQVNRIYSDFDLSFAANPVTGDVAKKYDVNAVKQSLKTLVLTRFYERPFQPKLGSPIYAFTVNITFYVFGIEGPFNFSTILRRSR